MWIKIKNYYQKIKAGRLSEFGVQVKWILNKSKKHTISMIIYTLVGLSGVAVGLLGSLVSRDLVDIVTGHKSGELIKTFILILVTSIGSALVTQLSSFISVKVETKVENEIKADIYEQILTSDWETLSSYHSGDLMSRMGGDVPRIASGILNTIPNYIVSLTRFISSLVIVINNDASFAIIALMSVPLSILISKKNLSRMSKVNMNNYKINAELSSFTQETFSSIQIVKAFDMIKESIKKFKKYQENYVKGIIKCQVVQSINSIIMVLLSTVITYSTYGWGVYKVWNGNITYGTMTLFISLSTALSGTLQNLLGAVPRTIAMLNSSKRLMEVADIPKENYSQYNEVQDFMKTNLSRGVSLYVNQLSFTYISGTEVFENVNIEAHPHEIVALIGPSGEGKTTMLRFLLSIINAKGGEGFICSGSSLNENQSDSISLSASTRQIFAYVPQGNTMFAGTIADNMRNVRPEASDEEIISALKIACAWKFIERLPDGIHSEIREAGGGFSEGQAQRLSIARAILRHSPILLLDEATSALDIETERNVLTNILNDDYPRTTIVTTHRPSVLNVCKRVYKINDKQCSIVDGKEIEAMLHN